MKTAKIANSVCEIGAYAFRDCDGSLPYSAGIYIDNIAVVYYQIRRDPVHRCINHAGQCPLIHMLHLIPPSWSYLQFLILMNKPVLTI